MKVVGRMLAMRRGIPLKFSLGNDDLRSIQTAVASAVLKNQATHLPSMCPSCEGFAVSPCKFDIVDVVHQWASHTLPRPPPITRTQLCKKGPKMRIFSIGEGHVASFYAARYLLIHLRRLVTRGADCVQGALLRLLPLCCRTCNW